MTTQVRTTQSLKNIYEGTQLKKYYYLKIIKIMVLLKSTSFYLFFA